MAAYYFEQVKNLKVILLPLSKSKINIFHLFARAVHDKLEDFFT